MKVHTEEGNSFFLSFSHKEQKRDIESNRKKGKGREGREREKKRERRGEERRREEKREERGERRGKERERSDVKGKWTQRENIKHLFVCRYH